MQFHFNSQPSTRQPAYCLSLLYGVLPTERWYTTTLCPPRTLSRIFCPSCLPVFVDETNVIALAYVCMHLSVTLRFLHFLMSVWPAGSPPTGAMYESALPCLSPLWPDSEQVGWFPTSQKGPGRGEEQASPTRRQLPLFVGAFGPTGTGMLAVHDRRHHELMTSGSRSSS